MNDSSRPLDNNEVVEDFLTHTLGLDYSADKKLKKIIAKIVDGEMGVKKFNLDGQTLSEKKMRIATWRDEGKRWELRERIVRELMTYQRIEDDEKIKMGSGGALPVSGVEAGKKAYIVIGLPASGKSGIAARIAEDNNAIIIDSDYAKRKLPEFDSHLYSASIVHAESSGIVHGFEANINSVGFKSLYEQCIEKSYNIVIPRIGQSPEGIIQLAKALKTNKGYEMHLILVSLPKRDATIRAIYRYAATGRYVPLGLIYDVYGNDPSHCYYYLRCKFPLLFDSFGVLYTIDKPPVYTDFEGKSPVLVYKFKDVILNLP